jgi:hypothetical protein
MRSVLFTDTKIGFIEGQIVTGWSEDCKKFVMSLVHEA